MPTVEITCSNRLSFKKSFFERLSLPCFAGFDLWIELEELGLASDLEMLSLTIFFGFGVRDRGG